MLTKTERNVVFQKYLHLVSEHNLWRYKASLKLYLDYLFQDIQFAGKSVLDVGGGSGLLSFYAAIQGSKNVICIEPEADGSDSGTKQEFDSLSDHLSLGDVHFKPVRFQDFNPHQKFDIVLLHNSINHLDEKSCITLETNVDSRKKYAPIFNKLSYIAAPSAKLMIVDCSRNNFFAALNLKNPFCPTIEWHKHQSPYFWATLLKQHGFIKPKIRWMPFSGLCIPGLLFNNPVVSYFLTSHFILTMDKVAF